MELLLLGILGILGAIWLYRHYFTSRLDISGPAAVPLLGNALDILSSNGLHWKMQEWSKKYGDVFKFRLLGEDIVVVSSYEGISEMLLTKSNQFAGRPYMFLQEVLVKEGIVFGDFNDKFKTYKKIGLRGIKQHGEGITRITELSKREIERCIEQIRAFSGKPFDPRDIVQTLMFRIVICLVIGESISTDDSDAKATMSWFNKMLGLAQWPSTFVLSVFTFTRHLGNPAWTTVQDIIKARDDQFTDWISRVENSPPTEEKTLLGELLVARDEGTITDEAVRGIIFDSLSAGIFTTFTSTGSFLLMLLNYPKVQTRLQQEIDEVIGQNRQPNIGDKEHMPYMQACILETLRYSSVIPLALPHKATTDTSLCNHFIPKNTQVWPNLYGMHHDTRYYDQPNVFIPERFLDNEGHVLCSDDRKMFMPFGAGRRVCMGEILAKTRMFLFFTRLLQQFSFLPEDPNNVPSAAMESFRNIKVTGVILPPPFKMIAEERNT